MDSGRKMSLMREEPECLVSLLSYDMLRAVLETLKKVGRECKTRNLDHFRLERSLETFHT